MTKEHVYSCEESAGFGSGREYHTAKCTCGWMAGNGGAGRLKELHEEHVIEAREAEARRNPPFYQVEHEGRTLVVPAASVTPMIMVKT